MLLYTNCKNYADESANSEISIHVTELRVDVLLEI